MTQRRILIIDDERGIRASLGLVLADEGYAVVEASCADEARVRISEGRYEVVLCDVRMPGDDGLTLLPELVAAQPDAVVIVMSAHGDVEQALAAVRGGASDYLAKPFEVDELLLAVQKADERARLRSENRQLRRELGRGRASGRLVAASRAMQDVYELVEHAAAFKTTVLITGESGVGKEVAARAVHELSDRAARPFVAINCGAIPEALIESELFGHARGAFTGADSAVPGVFREAHGGTLFLDEIGELPPVMQVKLLRVLQEEEVRPVGEAKPVPVDARIIAATARDLEEMVADGRFRADLFYRLNVFRIPIPPLRERREDIPLLADQLLESLSRRMGKPVAALDREVTEVLSARDWPGNVRELENALERALILARSDEVDLATLSPPGGVAAPDPRPAVPIATDGADEDLSVKRRFRALEEHLIRRALARTSGNRTQASRILELSPRALQYKLKEYEIDPLNPDPDASDTPS